MLCGCDPQEGFREGHVILSDVLCQGGQLGMLSAAGNGTPPKNDLSRVDFSYLGESMRQAVAGGPHSPVGLPGCGLLCSTFFGVGIHPNACCPLFAGQLLQSRCCPFSSRKQGRRDGILLFLVLRNESSRKFTSETYPWVPSCL